MPAPRPIADVLSQLIAKRGYARERAGAALTSAWTKAVGPQFAATTRAGNVRRGTLEITVANNLLAQELGFRKTELIEQLQRLAPDETITNLRFRTGRIAS